MNQLKCSRYIYIDDWIEKPLPCHCPVCGAFLAWNEKGEPECHKCGTELLMIPERDEDDGQELDWGKICPITDRKRK